MSTPSRTLSRKAKVEFPQLPAWLWAPCALYAVSAGCILVGISKIIIPLYDRIDFEQQMERFYCLAALNLYEVALLFVALLVVLRSRVFDDAIALTLIISIFLIASAVALDTVAPQFPEASLMFGLAGLLAASAKLFALDRFITGPLPRLMILGIALLLAANFLAPALLAHVNAGRATNLDLILPWRLGWGAALIAGGILIVAAMRVPTGGAGAGDIGRPFLRTTGMHWIVAGILFAGTVTHQYALTWAFNIPIVLAELTPAIGILALVALELLRGYGFRLAAVDSVVCLLPLAVTASVALLVHEKGVPAVDFGSPSDPAVFLALFAAAVSVNAWRREQTSLHHVASIYLVAAVLLVGVDPTLPLSVKIDSLNWNLAGFALGAALAAQAAAQGRANLAMASVLVLSGSLATCPFAVALAEQHRASQVAMTAVAFGVLTQVVYCAFRRSLPPRIGLLAAFALATGVIHLFFPAVWPVTKGRPVEPLDYPIISGTLTLIYLGAVSVWTRDWRLLVPGSVPIAIAALTAKEGQGWVWVGLSFIVLALGAAASIRKGSRRDDDDSRDVPLQTQSALADEAMPNHDLPTGDSPT